MRITPSVLITRTSCVFLVAWGMWCLAEDLWSQPAGEVGEKRLEAEKPSIEDIRNLKLYRDGKAVPPSDGKFYDRIAAGFVHRLTWIEIQKPTDPRYGPASIVDELMSLLPDPSKPASKDNEIDNQKKYAREFTKALLPAIDRVLTNPAPIARVNAARILEQLGSLGQENVLDTAAKALDDKTQLDAVKLYAARAIGAVFSTTPVKTEAREAAAVTALISLIQRPCSLPKDAAEELAAFRYVRQEAVQALAAYPKPALVSADKKFLAQPALVLLKIMRRDSPEPLPELAEQFEAALGVGSMQRKGIEAYEPSYAAHHLGHFFADYAAVYNDDKSSPLEKRQLPWKKNSLRWKQSLGGLKAEKDAIVVGVLEKIEPGLAAMYASQPINVNDLRSWLDVNQPTAKSLFAGDESAVVKPGRTE